jgi:hypothetical protein
MPHIRSDPFAGSDREELPRLPRPNLPEATARRGIAGSRWPALAAAGVVFVLLAGMVIFGVVMFRNPAAAATLRDIFIIILGVQSIIIGLLMVALLVAVLYAAFKVYDLAHFIQTEMVPILHRADDTMRTIHSRTVFVSDSAVKPVIEIMAYVSALKSIIRSFTRSTQ